MAAGEVDCEHDLFKDSYFIMLCSCDTVMSKFKDVQIVVNQNTLISLKPKAYLEQNPDEADICFVKIFGMQTLEKNL